MWGVEPRGHDRSRGVRVKHGSSRGLLETPEVMHFQPLPSSAPEPQDHDLSQDAVEDDGYGAEVGLRPRIRLGDCPTPGCSLAAMNGCSRSGRAHRRV